MNGVEFLNFAKTLLESNEEAALRTAVSRSYYATFHLVKEALISAGITVSKDPSEHRRLVHYLREGGRTAGISDANRYGDLLNDLRTFRNEADYDLHLTKFNKNTCKLQWKLAETVYETVNSNIESYKKAFVIYARSINEL